jgi:hypothetical protein
MMSSGEYPKVSGIKISVEGSVDDFKIAAKTIRTEEERLETFDILVSSRQLFPVVFVAVGWNLLVRYTDENGFPLRRSDICYTLFGVSWLAKASFNVVWLAMTSFDITRLVTTSFDIVWFPNIPLGIIRLVKTPFEIIWRELAPSPSGVSGVKTTGFPGPRSEPPADWETRRGRATEKITHPSEDQSMTGGVRLGV